MRRVTRGRADAVAAWLGAAGLATLVQPSDSLAPGAAQEGGGGGRRQGGRGGGREAPRRR